MKRKISQKCDTQGCLYGFGVIGALIYYWSTTAGLVGTLWGIVKAVFWPAVLVHAALKFFGV